MPLTRRGVLKTGMTAAVGTLLQPSYSKANPSPDTPESLVRVISNTDPAFDALFSATFPQITPTVIPAQLLAASFIITNLTAKSITSIGVDFTITSETDQYILAKTLGIPAGAQATYSGRSPLIPAATSLLVTPLYAFRQSSSPSPLGSTSSQSTSFTESQQYLLKKLSNATAVTLAVKAIVLDQTVLVGSHKILQMRARVVQAAEHDLANKLRERVNRGASPTDIEDDLSAFLRKAAVSIHYQRNNHRVYATAQQSFAIVLLKRLKSNPHAFLQALRSTTRQRRVGFTFYRVLPGETK